MTHTMRAITLGAGWTMSGCGTSEIELRERSLDVGEPLPLPASDASEETVEMPASPGEDEPSANEMPNVDGPLVPTGQLPDGFEGSPVTAPLDPGCQRIDFLFVIDNSDSMDDEQANLARSFPGFIRVMQQVSEASDFHIMVVGTGGEREEEDEPTLSAEDCEDIQGAGRRLSAQGDDCGIEGGLPFMAGGQPGLETTFSCVAQVGTDGSAIEEPIDAMLAATGTLLNAPGRCNAGFLRQDAILVVTFITDEEDRRSEGEPEEWRQALIDVKGGNEDAVVLLGLVGDNNVDGGLIGGPCRALDADGSPRLQQFVSSVDGVLGSVCAPDYTPFFQTAVGSIDSACSDFVPPVIF